MPLHCNKQKLSAKVTEWSGWVKNGTGAQDKTLSNSSVHADCIFFHSRTLGWTIYGNTFAPAFVIAVKDGSTYSRRIFTYTASRKWKSLWNWSNIVCKTQCAIWLWTLWPIWLVWFEMHVLTAWIWRPLLNGQTIYSQAACRKFVGFWRIQLSMGFQFWLTLFDRLDSSPHNSGYLTYVLRRRLSSTGAKREQKPQICFVSQSQSGRCFNGREIGVWFQGLRSLASVKLEDYQAVAPGI